MSDVNRLKTSIIEQSHQEGQAKLAEAKAQVEKDFEARKAHLLFEKDAERQSQIKAVNQRFQIEAQQIRNQERQSTLVSKQKILKELFAAALDKMTAWSAADELAFLQKILPKYAGQAVSVQFGDITANKFSSSDLEQVKQAFPNVTFEASAIAREAGFVVSDGKVDDTYLYANLIDSIYKEESSRIAADIFKEN
jgi:V/A-type H+-transporting ATPase subunit E